jgi:murein DD-endopeptidase MepM/ murein hydrolase activator NlpD
MSKEGLQPRPGSTILSRSTRTADGLDMIRAVVMVLLLLPVTACGWAEWPPPGREQPTIARPAEAKPPAVEAAARPAVDVSAAAVPPVSVETAALPPIVRQPSPPTVGMPGGTRTQAGKEHVIRQGETLYSVAQAYNVDIYALASANGLVAPYQIREGQALTIPSAEASRPVQEARAPVVPSPPSPQPQPQPQREAAAQKPMPAPPPVAVEEAATPIPAPPPISGDGFIWPVKGKIISAFGAKDQGNQNDGINISAPRGTPVQATENGVVAYAGNELRGFGNLVLIRHSDGWITAYAHNDQLLVRRGQIVRKGQDIATVGSSGGVAEPQLHFQMRQGKSAIDPTKHLRGGSA